MVKARKSFDFAIVGGGIVGLSCAYKLKLNVNNAINIKILYMLINFKIILFIIYY